MEPTANGCVVSLADGGQAATASYRADDLADRLERMEPGRLFRLVTGPGPDDFVRLNPFHVVAIAPAAITNPTSEEASPE